jgi:hypothetical protein
MKALTLWQPWATLVALGIKPFETRSWAPPLDLMGQRMAIHAAKLRIEKMKIPDAAAAKHALQLSGISGLDLPYGAVVGTVRLTGAYRVISGPLGSRNSMRRAVYFHGGSIPAAEIEIDEYGDYSQGRWAWRFDQVRPCYWPDVTGKQGLWNWEEAPLHQFHRP